MERRASHRAEGKQEVLARVADALVDLTLLDLSVSGCKARIGGRGFEAGTRVALDLFPNAPVEGEIVWCDNGLVGIRFSEELTLENFMQLVRNGLAEPQDEWFVRDTFGRCLPGPDARKVKRAKPSDNRSETRHELKCRVSLRMGYERDSKATIYNLSAGGCLIRHGFDLLAVEDSVNVSLPDFESFSGVVRWTKGYRAGIRFTRPLHPAVLELIIKRNLASPGLGARSEEPDSGAALKRVSV